jgi:hypothetical protein
MTVDELARLALETLNTQQRYFRGAAGSAEKSYALEESKKLERQLRQACNEIIDGPKLFT